MTDVMDITIASAVAAIERCKWVVPDEWEPGEPREDAGRQIVHCFVGRYMGADWDAEDAVALVRRADRVAFARFFLADGMCLAVEADNCVHWFDTVTPGEDAA